MHTLCCDNGRAQKSRVMEGCGLSSESVALARFVSAGGRHQRNLRRDSAEASCA